MKSQPIEKPFRFKQFEIYQDKCIMKVGTDGTLLGAWSGHKASNHILDIGTGTGLIALMLAQRFPMAKIDALELDVNAFKQAQENISRSKFKNRVSPIHGDFKDYVTDKKYDTIVSNPPFFSPNPGLANSQERISARQQVHLTWADLVLGIEKLLTDEGSAYLILPDQQKAELESEIKKLGLHVHKWCAIKGHDAAPVKRWMGAFGREHRETINESLVLRDKDGNPTTAYQELCKGFYLNW
jgi:tRNA1Val (adenine37-N6)-methyltransferase